MNNKVAIYLNGGCVVAVFLPDFLENFSHKVLNAAQLELEQNFDQKQGLQKVFFPEDMTFLNGEFRTIATRLFFNHLQVLEFQESTLASPRGVEPLLPA